MRNPLHRAIAGVAVLVLVCAGCSGQAEITGSWTPTAASGDGSPPTLSGVELNIMGKELTGNDGCASIQAQVEVVGKELSLSRFKVGEAQCAPDKEHLAGFVRRVLTSNPTITRTDDQMTLEGAEATLVLHRK